MDKELKKQLRREMEEKESRKDALSRVRRIGEDISLRGIGLIKLQIFVCPSFSVGECWDFRIAADKLNVYKSELLSEKGVFIPGYMKAQPGEEISEILLELQSFRIPIFTQQKNIGTLDGTVYQVHFFSGSSNVASLSWKSNPPEGWSDFINCFNKLLKILRSAKLTAVEA